MCHRTQLNPYHSFSFRCTLDPKKSYIWLYGCGPDRGGDGQSPGIRRKSWHHCLASYLLDYEGYLHVDGYEAYEKTDAKLVGCWAHARRKFIEAKQSQPKGKQGKDGKIQWAITWFQKLYRIKQEINPKQSAISEAAKDLAITEGVQSLVR